MSPIHNVPHTPPHSPTLPRAVLPCPCCAQYNRALPRLWHCRGICGASAEERVKAAGWQGWRSAGSGSMGAGAQLAVVAWAQCGARGRQCGSAGSVGMGAVVAWAGGRGMGAASAGARSNGRGMGRQKRLPPYRGRHGRRGRGERGLNYRRGEAAPGPRRGGHPQRLICILLNTFTTNNSPTASCQVCSRHSRSRLQSGY